MTKQGDKKIVVYTIGYEGMDIDEFIRTLEINKIEQILDVREIPISRKVGFSKSKLESRLSADGIRYIHMKELGSPKEIREKLHATHDYKEFFDSYRYYIGSNFSYIQDAWERVLEYRTCLMCFEKKPEECHRSVLAEYLLTTMPLISEVRHL